MRKAPRRFFAVLGFAAGVILAFVVVLWILSASLAKAQEVSPADIYYFYVSENGSWSYTDEAKRIPAKYVEKSLELKWKALREVTEKHWTSAGSNYAGIPSHLSYLPEPNPNWLRRCSGHVSVTTKRVQEGAYNREIYIVTDSCGDVVLVSPYPLTSVVFN